MSTGLHFSRCQLFTAFNRGNIGRLVRPKHHDIAERRSCPPDQVINFGRRVHSQHRDKLLHHRTFAAESLKTTQSLRWQRMIEDRGQREEPGPE